jgi:PAS domain S-box-containing protein
MHKDSRFELIPAGVLVHDKGVIVDANKVVCDMLGVAKEWLVGRAVKDFLNPNETQRVMERARRRARGEIVPAEYEVTFERRSDGMKRVAEINVSPHGDLSVVLVRDVTEAVLRRKKLFELAHLGVSLHGCHTEDEIRRVLNEGVTPLGIFNTWLTPTSTNKLRIEHIDLPDGGAGFLRVVGAPIKGFEGQWTPWFQRVWECGEAYTDDAIAEVSHFVGTPWESEMQKLAAAIQMTHGMALRIDIGGEPSSILVVRGPWLREDDMHLGHLLRARISGAIDNVRAQSRVVERERLAAIGEVAAVVAHEVRNPLAVIFNAVSALRRQTDATSGAPAMLKTIQDEADRLNQMVGDLLGFARPVTPRMTLDALGPLAEGAMEAAFAKVSGGMRDGNYQTTFEASEDLPLVSMDARLVRQALLNVMLNAIDAMPTGGSLHVTVCRSSSGHHVTVIVRDSGEGIPDAIRTKIFEPFYTTRPSGTGLGLAIVKRIVDAHNAVITVENGEICGTVVTLAWAVSPQSLMQDLPLREPVLAPVVRDASLRV